MVVSYVRSPGHSVGAHQGSHISSSWIWLQSRTQRHPPPPGDSRCTGIFWRVYLPCICLSLEEWHSCRPCPPGTYHPEAEADIKRILTYYTHVRQCHGDLEGEYGHVFFPLRAPAPHVIPSSEDHTSRSFPGLCLVCSRMWLQHPKGRSPAAPVIPLSSVSNSGLDMRTRLPTPEVPGQHQGPSFEFTILTAAETRSCLFWGERGFPQTHAGCCITVLEALSVELILLHTWQW